MIDYVVVNKNCANIFVNYADYDKKDVNNFYSQKQNVCKYLQLNKNNSTQRMWCPE